MSLNSDCKQTTTGTPTSSKYNLHVNSAYLGGMLKCRPNSPRDLKVKIGECTNITIGDNKFNTKNISVVSPITAKSSSGELTVDIQALVGGSMTTQTILLYAWNSEGVLTFGYKIGGLQFTVGDPLTYPADAAFPIAEIVLTLGMTEITESSITDVRGAVDNNGAASNGFVPLFSDLITYNATVNLAYSEVGDSWTSKTAVGNSKNNGGCLSYGGKSYACAGAPYPYSPTVFQYELGVDTWTQLSNYPGPSTFSNKGTTVGDYGYIYGGSGASLNDDVTQFNYGTEAWVTKTPSLVNRYAHGMAWPLEIDAFFAYGGRSYAALTINQQYTVLSDAWTFKSGLTTKTWVLAFDNIGTKCYAWLGRNGDTGAPYTSVNDEYDYLGDSWTVQTAVPVTASDGMTGNGDYDGKGYCLPVGTATQQYLQSGDSWTTMSVRGTSGDNSWMGGKF